MELKEALVHTGVCKPEDIGHLTLHVQISDGVRNVQASSRRYFVSLKGRAVCSVKRLPKNGIFDLEDIIQTQRLFSKFSSCTAPVIYGVYHGNDNYVYFVEENIQASNTLHNAIACGEVLPEEAALIINSIFQELAVQPTLNSDKDLLDREIGEFFTGMELLDVPKDLKEWLKTELDKYMNNLVGHVLYTSRDLIPKNILILQNKPVVVDFDLSRRTYFLWLDIYRSKYYANEVSRKIEYLRYMPEGIDHLLLELLFWLSEVRLQQLVLSEIEFLRLIDYFRSKIISYFDRLLPNNYTASNRIIPKAVLPKVDGCKVPETTTSMLQLFWEDNAVFSEESSVRVPLIIDNYFHQYDIPFPPNALGSLRIDPVDQYAYVEIKSIALYKCESDATADTSPLILWSEENKFEGLLLGTGVICLNGNGIKRLLCINNDPQLLLENLPAKNDEHPWILRVILKINTNLPEITFDVTKQFQEEVKKRDVQLSKQTWELKRLRTELTEKAAILAEKDAEMTRQDGQLSLLTNELRSITVKLTKREEELSHLREELKQLINSRSWQMTAPLRRMGLICQKVRNTVGGLLEFVIRRKV